MYSNSRHLYSRRFFPFPLSLSLSLDAVIELACVDRLMLGWINIYNSSLIMGLAMIDITLFSLYI